MARSKPDEPAGGKAERTRQQIVDAALTLFRRHGYDETSMRAIADAAGVSLGNAYYYFASKEHLVQEFYALTHVEHLAAVEPLLAKEKDLAKRLRHVLRTKIETAEPYHHFAAVLFKTAADPKSPLNPFSAESRTVRVGAIALMERVIDGSSAKVPSDLREQLPHLLWLHEMAVILFWLHDDSRGRKRTQRLIDHTVDLVTKLISLASFPLMRPLRKSTLELVEELRRDVEPAGD
jgi:AcrR family transcriptional regulator